MISISALLSIAFLIVYFLLDWYAQEFTHEAQAKNEEDYVPEIDFKIGKTADGTNDYSELYAGAIEERRKAKRSMVEVSSIEGTETELLLSALQQDLNNDDNDESLANALALEGANFQEQEMIGQDEPIQEEEIQVEEPSSIETESFDTQERIYVLRNRLSNFSREDADMVDIEAMILTQYELFQLEGREDQVQQLERDFFMYFPKTSNRPTSETIPKVFEEDILTLEDMEMEREEPRTTSQKHSTSTISDNIHGLQRWRGVVIGKSEDYIHFQDNSRIWIKAANKVNKIHTGDELILEVLRSENEVILKQMFRVKGKNNQQQLNVVNQ